MFHHSRFFVCHWARKSHERWLCVGSGQRPKVFATTCAGHGERTTKAETGSGSPEIKISHFGFIESVRTVVFRVFSKEDVQGSGLIELLTPIRDGLSLSVPEDTLNRRPD